MTEVLPSFTARSSGRFRLVPSALPLELSMPHAAATRAKEGPLRKETAVECEPREELRVTPLHARVGRGASDAQCHRAPERDEPGRAHAHEEDQSKDECLGLPCCFMCTLSALSP